jgi:signal transduction histidine kinase
VKATDRGSSLSQGLPAFSRKQVLSPKAVDPNTLIAGQIDMLKRLITESIDLKFVSNPSCWIVRVDASQIEQVVMNLFINARDAMLTGGEIVIESSNVDISLADRRAPSPLPPGSYVLLSVSDNGCGLDAETASHIFEPFFTTKPQGKGTPAITGRIKSRTTGFHNQFREASVTGCGGVIIEQNFGVCVFAFQYAHTGAAMKMRPKRP